MEGQMAWPKAGHRGLYYFGAQGPIPWAGPGTESREEQAHKAPGEIPFGCKKRGYAAAWSSTFDQSKEILDRYFSGEDLGGMKAFL